jgi:hypothetical protein
MLDGASWWLCVGRSGLVCFATADVDVDFESFDVWLDNVDGGD